MADYDPIPDAIEFLARKPPIERHAIARLMELDGPALSVQRWIVEQPDCDRATAAMTFWRLRGLPTRPHLAQQYDVSTRSAVLESIAAHAKAGGYTTTAIAWDGLEAWDRTPLVGIPRLDAVTATESAIPPGFFGPFGTTKPEPAIGVFLDHDYGDDDIFDSLWRVSPLYAAAADWLAGKSADLWMAAVDEMQGSHPDAIHNWMLLQPECPSSVAGQIFWLSEPGWHAKQQLEGKANSGSTPEVIEHVLARWKKGDLKPCDVDFSRYADAAGYRAIVDRFPGSSDPLAVPPDLLNPPKGRVPAPVCLYEDFDFWILRVDLAGVVPRPREAALAAWNTERVEWPKRQREHAAAGAPSMLERLFYGGKFTGTQTQIDRCWKQFNVVMAGGAILLVALMRGGAPTGVSFSVFLGLVAVLSLYLSSAKMGSVRRIVGWWVGAFVLSMALARLFRWIDKGAAP